MNIASAIASASPAPVPTASIPDAGTAAKPEAIELNLDDPENPNRTDESEWADLVSILNDERERDLLRRFYALYRDAGLLLHAAYKSEHPKTITAEWRSAISALKSMLIEIKALDHHRHGTVQEIIVEYDGEHVPQPEPTIAEVELAISDRYIDELFLGCVENLDAVAIHCRKEAKILSALTVRELSGKDRGHRIGPDRRTWEVKFMGMAAHLTGQVTKFGQAIEKCHGHRPQRIHVSRVGNVPKGKLTKNTATAPNGSIGGTLYADAASGAH